MPPRFPVSARQKTIAMDAEGTGDAILPTLRHPPVLVRRFAKAAAEYTSSVVTRGFRPQRGLAWLRRLGVSFRGLE
jgi:hypothetical protein